MMCPERGHPPSLAGKLSLPFFPASLSITPWSLHAEHWVTLQSPDILLPCTPTPPLLPPRPPPQRPGHNSLLKCESPLGHNTDGFQALQEPPRVNPGGSVQVRPGCPCSGLSPLCRRSPAQGLCFLDPAGNVPRKE